MKLWRQGDILIQEVAAVPRNAAKRDDLVLAEGVATGHRHEVRPAQAAMLFEERDTLYLRVRDAVTVTHPEHKPISLGAGIYKVWRQREFADEGRTRIVID